MMDAQITEATIRYERARRQNLQRVRCAIRLRLATIRGIRHMFFEYAERLMDEMESLQERIRQVLITEEEEINA